MAPQAPLTHAPGNAPSSFVEQPVAVAPDVIYAVAMNLTDEAWEIDRIAR